MKRKFALCFILILCTILFVSTGSVKAGKVVSDPRVEIVQKVQLWMEIILFL